MVAASGNEIIQAAGGLVWRKDKGAVKVAIIQRQRYGVKWTLPKGKVEKGETWLGAAKREVSEEIGIDQKEIRVVSFAGGTVYLVGDKPKIVLYWNMLIEEKAEFGVTAPEVTQVKWLSFEDALNILDHPKEKQVLAEAWQKGDIKNG